MKIGFDTAEKGQANILGVLQKMQFMLFFKSARITGQYDSTFFSTTAFFHHILSRGCYPIFDGEKDCMASFIHLSMMIHPFIHARPAAGAVAVPARLGPRGRGRRGALRYAGGGGPGEERGGPGDGRRGALGRRSPKRRFPRSTSLAASSRLRFSRMNRMMY